MHIDFAFDSSFFTKEKFGEITAQLISSCDPSVCHSTEIAQIIIQGSLSQHHQMIHILNEKGLLCLRFALEVVKTQLDQYNRVPITCESLIGENKKNCQDIQNKYAAMSDRVLSLVNLMVSQQPNLIKPFALQLEDRIPSPYLNSRLLNVLQRLEDEEFCSQYKIGEERKFIITPVQSVILPYVHYRVKRESEKHYKAFVTLEFAPHSSYRDRFPVPKDELHHHYMEHVRYCVRVANPKMKGPHGETLEIVIEEAQQANSCTPKHLIEVGSIQAKRASAIYFRTSPMMSCEVTLHEIIHLLSLWDEHKGIQNVGRPKSDCRVFQDNSMLGGYKKRWRNIFQKPINNSLLDPSHFQAIVYGNCSLRSDVNLYRQCSRLAYQNSNNNSACLKQKAYCENQNILGRDKVVEQNRINLEIEDWQRDLNLTKDQIRASPELPEDDPKYDDRNKLFNQKKQAEQRIRDLERRLNFVLAWPD